MEVVYPTKRLAKRRSRRINVFAVAWLLRMLWEVRCDWLCRKTLATISKTPLAPIVLKGTPEKGSVPRFQPLRASVRYPKAAILARLGSLAYEFRSTNIIVYFILIEIMRILLYYSLMLPLPLHFYKGLIFRVFSLSKAFRFDHVSAPGVPTLSYTRARAYERCSSLSREYILK